MSKETIKAYYDGVKEGVYRYAWWKDGSQYVGTTGTTLKRALEEIEKEFSNDIETVESINKQLKK